MNAFKRYKNCLEKYLQTEPGKRFINFAYSFGAAIVILGAMFKLLHFPFGNEMLFIGMVTECMVFILSAFDTPVRDYQWEKVFPTLSGNANVSDNPTLDPDISKRPTTTMPQGQKSSLTAKKDIGNQTSLEHVGLNYEIPSNLSAHTEAYAKQMENLNHTLSGLNAIYELQLKSISSQIGAIEQINQGLSRLSNMYADTPSEGWAIKEETKKMANQLKQLNEVYSRMLKAMTVYKQEESGNPNS